MKLINKKLKSCIFAIVFIFLLCQVGFLGILPEKLLITKIVQYADDALELILIVALLFVFFARKMRLLKIEYVMIISMAVFDLFGFISSLIFKYQPIFVVLTDMAVCTRFVVFYIATRVFFDDFYENKTALVYIANVCKVFSVIFAFLCIHDSLSSRPFYPQYDFRYFSTSMKFFFETQSGFGAFMFCTAMPIALKSTSSEKINKIDVICFVLAIFSATMCQRAKTMAAAVLALVLFAVFCLMRVKITQKIGIIAGLFSAIAGFVFGIDRITAFYANTKMARSMLLRDGIKLATEYFPLGTGFGTFGTNTAFKNWSPLYSTLGYEYGIEVYDVFWPGVIAQPGWIGFAAFVLVVSCFIVLSYKTAKYSAAAFVATLSSAIYLSFSSFGEAAFFLPSLSPLFLVFAISVNMCKMNGTVQNEK